MASTIRQKLEHFVSQIFGDYPTEVWLEDVSAGCDTVPSLLKRVSIVLWPKVNSGFTLSSVDWKSQHKMSTIVVAEGKTPEEAFEAAGDQLTSLVWQSLFPQSLTLLPVLPCATCGRPTPSLGTKRCDRCWEFESRLGDYLAIGENARAFVRRSLGALSTNPLN